MTENKRTGRCIFLAILLLLSLLIASCTPKASSDEGDESKATQPATAEATQLPSGKATSPPAGYSGEEVQVASPNELNSFRAQKTSWVKEVDGSETTETTTMEYVREPRAYHFSRSKAQGEPEEQIRVGDTLWAKVDVDYWREQQGMLIDSRWLLDFVGPIVLLPMGKTNPDGSTTWPDIKLVGKETVNGVQCKHYVYDWTIPYAMHWDIWVADQGDLPPVIVRLLRQASQKGYQDIEETETEINVTDINTSITIEPPK